MCTCICRKIYNSFALALKQGRKDRQRLAILPIFNALSSIFYAFRQCTYPVHIQCYYTGILVPLVEQKLPTLPEHLSSPPVFSGVRVDLSFVFCVEFSGADPGFQVKGGALKKIAPSRGRREHFWGISCEKSRFYAKKSYFFQFQGWGGAGCSAPDHHGQATGKFYHLRVECTLFVIYKAGREPTPYW